MGKSVPLSDLARTSIHLSGLIVRDEESSDGEIAVFEIGLRHGEKPYEQLLIDVDVTP